MGSAKNHDIKSFSKLQVCRVMYSLEVIALYLSLPAIVNRDPTPIKEYVNT